MKVMKITIIGKMVSDNLDNQFSFNVLESHHMLTISNNEEVKDDGLSLRYTFERTINLELSCVNKNEQQIIRELKHELKKFETQSETDQELTVMKDVKT